MIELLIVLVVLGIVAWIVSLMPLPASPIPVKTIAYILIGLAAIVFLLRFAGIA